MHVLCVKLFILFSTSLPLIGTKLGNIMGIEKKKDEDEEKFDADTDTADYKKVRIECKNPLKSLNFRSYKFISGLTNLFPCSFAQNNLFSPF